SQESRRDKPASTACSDRRLFEVGSKVVWADAASGNKLHVAERPRERLQEAESAHRVRWEQLHKCRAGAHGCIDLGRRARSGDAWDACRHAQIDQLGIGRWRDNELRT